MNVRRLVYLGTTADAAAVLRCEGKLVEPDTAVLLERRRSPWRKSSPQVRVIVGSHPVRADVRLEGQRIFPEHLRFYFSREGDGPVDVRALHDGSTRLNGEPVLALEWLTLEGGEEIALGPWRWRYELVRS